MLVLFVVSFFHRGSPSKSLFGTFAPCDRDSLSLQTHIPSHSNFNPCTKAPETATQPVITVQAFPGLRQEAASAFHVCDYNLNRRHTHSLLPSASPSACSLPAHTPCCTMTTLNATALGSLTIKAGAQASGWVSWGTTFPCSQSDCKFQTLTLK